jgi:putative DNA primase/helicase
MTEKNTHRRIVLPQPGRNRKMMDGAQIAAVLDNDPAFKRAFVFDEAKNHVLMDGVPMRDRDYTHLEVDIRAAYRFGNVPTAALYREVFNIATRNTRNAVKEYLEGLEWDGVERLRDLPRKRLGCAETSPDIYGRYTETWCISGVARVLAPGCKVDAILVLNGPQGTFKSTFFRVMSSGPGDTYFFDSPLDVGSKDGMASLAGSWIIEWAEFETMIQSKKSGEIKAYLSTTIDKFRPAYARTNEEIPRKCVFGASTNVREVFKDPTGARRFMALQTGMIDIEGVKQDRDQLWAEAAFKYKRGDKWFLSPEEMSAQEAANKSFDRGAAVREAITRHVMAQPGTVELDYLAQQDLADRHGASLVEVKKILKDLGFVPERSRKEGEQKRFLVRGAVPAAG